MASNLTSGLLEALGDNRDKRHLVTGRVLGWNPDETLRQLHDESPVDHLGGRATGNSGSVHRLTY